VSTCIATTAKNSTTGTSGNLAQEAAEIGDVISSIDAWLADMYGDRSSRPQSDLLRAAGLK
jgi:hypothetical protein